jgi:glutamine amidotransferase
MLVIIDYGLGNLGSIQNMLKKIGVKSIISADKEIIHQATKLILPGVGSFDYGMEQLTQLSLVEVIKEKVIKEKTPILGICLGVQLFTQKSEEGKMSGLGFIEGETVKFNFAENTAHLKIPHMGWNDVCAEKESKLLKDMPEDMRFYFVHSYHLKMKNEKDTLLKSHYGFDFACGIEKEHIVGVQFHPEKSHRFGMQLLKNFVELY